MTSITPGKANTADFIVGLAVAVVTALQGIVVVATKSERWSGHWPSASAAVGWAALWGCCVVAASTAWVVASARRHHFEYLIQTASRSHFAVYRAPLLMVALGSVMGYTAVLGYIVAITASRATHGRLNVVELAGTLASVLLGVGLGAVVGRVAPTRLAPITAAVVPYVIYMLLIYGDAYSGNILFADISFTDQIDRTYLRLPVELLLGRAVFWAALGTALLAWALLATRAAYTAVLVASFGLSAVLVTAGTRSEEQTEYRAVCFAGSPTICVDRAHQHLADEYVGRVRANADAMVGTDFATTTVVATESLEQELRQHRSPSSVRVMLVPIVKRSTSPAHEINPRALDASFGAAVFLHPCQRLGAGDTDAGITAGARMALTLYSWWLTTRGISLDGSNYPGEPDIQLLAATDPAIGATQQTFSRLSASAQIAWITTNQDGIRNCRALPLP
ncbi:hypothetical protein [Micromonospora sp. KC721]|uniref:hypothetical protein n=1 Tax=Micromonospora sp. KC721 TaxID=2530380 RepID=UPI00104EDA8E|nr:hypothetical protein [Micromonospora sp. KC721]TDB79060.1 hypothetical protein E1182_14000 [Micromonospora sp. KC721]